MTFELPLANQVDDPNYWYVFAYLDLSAQRLNEWLFLVPSRVVHAHRRREVRGGGPLFTFQASMEGAAHDQWTEYRLRPEELGERLVELIRKAPRGFGASRVLEALHGADGVCLLSL
jgi:hypothetical protein